MFNLEFVEGWDKFFLKFDKSEKHKIWKKIQSLKTLKTARHLRHGFPFFVVEAGQHRICFEEQNNNRRIMFAGNHKQYLQWLRKI
ncbi:MAG: hypothetical protein V1672_04355 [Candidatus Diapherotrites archaeon]